MLRSNTPIVVSETIDGEAMIMHNGTGHYFCANGSAALLWDAVQHGATLQSLSEIATIVCHLGAPVALDQATSFIALLRRHDLVVADAGVPVQTELPSRPEAPLPLPTLEVFTDLADMLLLDPIHDVDETGWPSQQPTSR